MRSWRCSLGWLAALALGGCVDLFRPYAEPNPDNCVANPGLCGAGQRCGPLTQVCEPVPGPPLPLTLRAVTPPVGPSAGGIDLVLTGTGFLPETLVRVGDVPAGNVRLESPERLLATLPPRPSFCGLVGVSVENPGSPPVFLDGHFRYYAPTLAFAPVTRQSFGRPSALAVGDLDLEGLPDLVVAHRLSGLDLEVTPLYGQPSGAYVAGQGKATGEAGDVAVSDMDGDGRPDLVLLRPGAGMVEIYRQIARDSFTASSRIATPGPPTQLALADLDRDGKVDIVAATLSPSAWIIRQVGGTFQPVRLTSCAARAVKIADLNRDGLPDVVLACTDDGMIRVHLGRTDATFSAAIGSPAGGKPASLALTDLDQDGRLDLAAGVVAAGDGGGHGFVLRGLGDGRFAEPQALFVAGLSPLAGDEHQVAAGDLDCDQVDEVLLAVAGNLNQVAVFSRAADGRLAQRAAAGLAVGAAPRRMVATDLDYEGRSDVVLALPDDDTVAVLRNASN